MENIGAYFDLAAAVVTVASLVANLTPTDKDNKAVGFISGLINMLALNFRRGR